MQSTLPNLPNVVCSRLSHFDMFNSKRRLTTFSGWPSSSSPTPQQLVDCGFYYVGVNDGTTCFACGLYVEGWKPWDDPWVRHRRCAQDCSFLARHLATGQRTEARTLLVEVDSVVAEAVKKEGSTPVTLAKLHAILRTTDRATRKMDLEKNHVSQTDFLRDQHYVDEEATYERHIREMDEFLKRYRWETIESEKRHTKEMDEYEERYQKETDKFEECPRRELHEFEERQRLEMVKFDELQLLEMNLIKLRKRRDMILYQRRYRLKNIEDRERYLKKVEECIARHRLENIENRFRHLKIVEECTVRHRREKNDIIARHEVEVAALERQQKSDCAELDAEYAQPNTVSIPVPNTPDLLTCSICVSAQKEMVFRPCGHFTACSVCARKFVQCPVCRGPIDYVIKVFVT